MMPALETTASRRPNDDRRVDRVARFARLRTSPSMTDDAALAAKTRGAIRVRQIDNADPPADDKQMVRDGAADAVRRPGDQRQPVW